MGKAFVENVLHHGNPSVGLLNVGEEPSKGNQFSQEAYRLLQRDEPNFIGNVEGGAMIAGAADIVVSDGFIGNIAIKMGEAMTTLVTTRLRRAVESKLRYLFGAWLLRGAFAALRERTDYQRVGGAPLIGVNGAVVIGHGRADAEAVASGVRLARTMAESGYVDTVRQALANTAPIVEREPAEPTSASVDSTPTPTASPVNSAGN
jgi:glycerol-3-phosphate acyltransferase PlsX